MEPEPHWWRNQLWVLEITEKNNKLEGETLLPRLVVCLVSEELIVMFVGSDPSFTEVKRRVLHPPLLFLSFIWLRRSRETLAKLRHITRPPARLCLSWVRKRKHTADGGVTSLRTYWIKSKLCWKLVKNLFSVYFKVVGVYRLYQLCVQPLHIVFYLTRVEGENKTLLFNKQTARHTGGSYWSGITSTMWIIHEGETWNLT